MAFRQQLEEYAAWIENALDEALPLTDCPQQDVISAMRYSLLGGGKRLRGALLLAFCEACGGSREEASDFASAVEMIQAYSLIHDDLPCMDDDDLRRGKPSCHIAYGEANALLAGDGLLTHAFDLLLHSKAESQRILKGAACLSEAIGCYGMIGGQVMDLANESRSDVDEARLRQTEDLKCGALIAAACKMGCIAAGAFDKVPAAAVYGEKIGLAFQIADDILDVCSSTEVLGKPVGSDEMQEKTTYVTLLGVEKARQLAQQLLREAKEELNNAALASDFLQDMADYILNRKN